MMFATSHPTTFGLSWTQATTPTAIGMRSHFNVVNKLGYVITRKPWSKTTPDAIYFLDDFEQVPANSA